MRHFVFVAAATAVVAMSGVALADQPPDNPINNGLQAVDCSDVITETSDEPKNIGQVQQVIRTNPELFDNTNNLAQLGMVIEEDIGLQTGEFMQKNLFICGIGSGDPS